ncbi:Pentatricopeptide repeat-containing protein [Thalictrum thalictroides]|uniref:Pentatricopeptide repeat-containing protein n=1 Tax=Thalictrum thalictroides TaxID=46969 RepID=A0A7J6VYI9_THATH|nr:Pentatricopeptide repeat-containing protein [Thalictrum thalictroides]
MNGVVMRIGCHRNHFFSSSSSLTKCTYCHSSSETTTTKSNNNSKQKHEDFKSSKTKKAKTIARLINKEPWTPTLESSLSQFSKHLSNTTVLQSIRLIRTSPKALKFFDWVQANNYIHTDQSYFELLELLGRTRNLNAARNLLFSIEKKSNGSVKLQARFFNSLIRSYGQAGLLKEALKLFMRMKSVQVPPCVITFNSLFFILLRRGRTNMAKKLFDEMLTSGVVPDVFTFNTLIRGFCMNSMVDDGFQFFNEMSKFQCNPDVITYNTLVDGLCRAGKVRIAHNVVKGMCRKSSDLNPNVVTYTTLIRGYCGKQCIGEALDVFEEMRGSGMRPNRITYNTLIQGLCEARKFDKIKEVLEGMIRGGEFTPDTCTFNTLINAHCNADKLDEGLEVFMKMKDLGVQPDSASYSILIRNLCQEKEVERAEELFDELSEKEILVHDKGCVPLVAAYNPIFEYLCANGKTKKAERVFRQLFKRGTQDPPAFKTLIMGNCKEGTFEAGYKLLVLMLRRDFVPDVEIYESLIEGFLKKNEPKFSLETLKKMLKSSLCPRTSIFHSILTALVKEGCASEAASLVMVMLERKIRQNINLSTDTIVVLFKNGLKDTAFEIIGLLHDNGYSIKMEKVVSILCRNREFLEARQLLLFSLEKQQTVNIEMYDKVITGLCKVKSAAEAFGLYYELIEKVRQPGLKHLGGLKEALEADGRLDEAEFVLKRINQKH